MDEIKTNISKIFEQYTDIMSHSVPKRLSFSLNDSIGNSGKKRRISEEHDNAEKKVKQENSSFDISANGSITVPSSPWESRRLKADLIDAKSQITQLKQEIDRQTKVRNELEILYKSKVESLQSQVDHSTSKITDMEKHLINLRKREAHSREELTKLKNEMVLNKQNYEEMIHELTKENQDLNEDFNSEKNDLLNQIGELQRQLMEAEQNFKSEQEEYEAINDMYLALQEKMEKYENMERLLNTEQQKTLKLQQQVSELEYEISGYGEWKTLSKSVQGKLNNLSDLEKEVVRIRQENKNLRDSVGNKLILEEQVYDLKTRLENADKSSNENVNLKVQIATLEQELKTWRSIATDHCPSNVPQTAGSLRKHLEVILQNDLVLTSEKGSAKCEKNVLKDKLTELEMQQEMLQKTNNDLKVIVKRHQNIIQKLQKKLIIVAGERDCYKRLLDNYEKDLTISGNQTQNNNDNQTRLRIEMLERTVSGYKEMCANLEQELQMNKSHPEPALDSIVNDNYDKLRKELNSLRVENEKIKRRKEELELELEQRSLKGDFNTEKYKILHFMSNPAAEAYENNKNEIEKLQIEIERLKRKIVKLEENEQEMTIRMNDTNVTVNVKEVNVLRVQIQSLESKNQHLKEVYKAASQEFRDVCYMLFGFRVDRVGNANYRISSMYAETEEDYLNFRLNESGVLDMLETEYSISLADMMRTHLVTHNSLPAFLSSLTLDLFNKTTVMS